MTYVPLYPLYMGETPSPPRIPPPYSDKMTVKRGDNPLYKVFIKKFQKKFLGKF
jgi:hypothetical protein